MERCSRFTWVAKCVSTSLPSVRSRSSQPHDILIKNFKSQDHTRRLSRFKAHITSPDFPSTSQTVDARLIAAQLDSLVFARLSAQTTSGASSSSKLPSNPTPAKPITKEAALSAAQAKTAALKLAAEQEGISKRQALREAKAKKNKAKREARKEKGERIKRRKEKAGEVVEYVARSPTLAGARSRRHEGMLT